MPNIHHQVLIGAPAEKIYDALTTQEGLAGWWTPDVKARPERDSVARFGFGQKYFKEMKITGLQPAKRVTWLCITGADEWRGTTLSFELQGGDKGTLLNSHPELSDQINQQKNGTTVTLLIFHHDDWREDSPMFGECSYTWGQFLRSLKSLCEIGKGRPWPNQHRSEA